MERERKLILHVENAEAFWVRFNEPDNTDVVWGRLIPREDRLVNGAPNSDTATCLVERFNANAEALRLNERLAITVADRFHYSITSDGEIVTRIGDDHDRLIWLDAKWSAKLIDAWNAQLKLAAVAA